MIDKTILKTTNILTELEELKQTFQNDLKELKEEIDELEKRKREMVDFQSVLDTSLIADPITLNIGGASFQTSKATLTKVKGSYFDAMFSGFNNIKSLEPNSFFIDRDEDYGRIPVKVRSDVDIEMKFYGLTKTSECSFLDSVQFKIIREWLPKKKFKLLYSGSRDGFESKTFHNKCDGKGPTLSIIMNDDGDVFGGFKKENWTGNSIKTGPSSFLFSIVSQNQTKPSMFSPKDMKETSEFTILPLDNVGIIFGDDGWGIDLYIADKSNTNKDSFIDLGKTFNSSPLFNSKKINFKVSDIQIKLYESFYINYYDETAKIKSSKSLISLKIDANNKDLLKQSIQH
ncbi:hypothetical protein DFA_06969 [Cavenderia fasciculata]|uniref:TLDc domain-containing protein n=1 Tax=Cavenderia fasciculata TaxID=261658 RepID=F4PX63_CACFS|nr:uncharacterized protein DFA_06969 [Cavenderia fasciculata]EGG19866.1 hypothetical protein DFA_06969 [Cavenderia fasciculata]|eukprot:XP_004358212.1 hypothetical protein DFA_06969 [Cavenderia fasciculata]